MLRHVLKLGMIVGFCVYGFGQSITLHLLDGKSGQPLPNLHVTISGTRDGRFLSVESEGDEHKVDANNEPFLQFVDVKSSTAKGDFVLCAPSKTFFDVKQIQKKGVTSTNTCSKKSYPTTPGEFVIFIRKERWWDRWKDFG